MFYVYILASGRNGTLSTGSTDDIGRRVFEHKEKTFRGLAAKYGVRTPVWYEGHESREAAFSGSGRSRNGSAPGRSR